MTEITKKSTHDHLETQLKEVWAQYINHVDKKGLDDTAQTLRRKYLRLYQSYRRNRHWRKIM